MSSDYVLIKKIENETEDFYSILQRLDKLKDSEDNKLRILLLKNQIKLNKVGILILKCNDPKISKMYHKKVIDLTHECQEIVDDLSDVNAINDGLYLRFCNGHKDFVEQLENIEW